MDFSIFLLQTAPKAEPNMWTTYIFMGLIFVVFYFFMIRPQTQKRKKEDEYRASLQKGDKIVTIRGIYGKIINVTENSVLIEISNGVKVEMQKTAISRRPDTVEAK